MSKVLVITYYHEVYYEPSIEIEVMDEKDVKPIHHSNSTYIVCKTSKDFSDFLMYHSDDFDRHLQIEFSVADIKAVANINFYYLVDNYEYIQILKNKAYKVSTAKNDIIDKFRKDVYHDEGGYGSFRQEIILFGDLGFVLKYTADFKRNVDNKLMSKYAILLDDDTKKFKLKELKATLDGIDRNDEYFANELARIHKNLDSNKKDRARIVKEIEELEK